MANMYWSKLCICIIVWFIYVIEHWELFQTYILASDGIWWIHCLHCDLVHMDVGFSLEVAIYDFKYRMCFHVILVSAWLILQMSGSMFNVLIYFMYNLVKVMDFNRSVIISKLYWSGCLLSVETVKMMFKFFPFEFDEPKT